MVAVAVWAQVAAGGQVEPAPLEVALDQLKIPDAEILGWKLVIDGAEVAAPKSSGSAPGQTQWTQLVPPGLHSVGVEVRYRRDLKTVVTGEDESVGFTFAAGGVWSVDSAASVNVRPGTGIRVTAVIDEDPAAVADRLLLLQSGNTQAALAAAEAEKSRLVLENFLKLFSKKGGRLTPQPATW